MYRLLSFRSAVTALIALAVIACLVTPASAASSKYDFKLEEVSTGQELDFELLTEGKPLIFHVWSPDCPHCQRHMPYLVALYKKVDLGQVNFVTCSMGDTKKAALDYVSSKKLEFPVLYGPGGKMSDALADNGWPTTFVFSAGGKFVGYCDTQSPSYVGEMVDLIDKALKQ